MINRCMTIMIFLTFTAAACNAAGTAQPRFATPPSVENGTNAVVISFTAGATCDVTVAILSDSNRVIRHLVSGVLGPNAPEPLQKNSLAQRLEWDRKDDSGSTVGAGQLSVRVSLGLKPVFTRMLLEKPIGIGSRAPLGLAVDANGLLYIEEGDSYIQENGLAGALQTFNVKVFDSKGRYLRSLLPFRGDLPAGKITAVQFTTTLDGRRIPMALSGGNHCYGGFLPGTAKIVLNTPVITGNGQFLFPCGDIVEGRRRLLSIGTDGSAIKGTFAGPPLQPDAKVCAQIFMALSPDGKTIYYTGARSKLKKGSSLTHAVYRTTPESKDFAAPFIGAEFSPGTAESSFNDPRGIDVDTEGRIWVCDYLNDRIQIFTPDGRFIKSFKVPGPAQIRIHPRSAAIYVLSVADRGATSTAWNETWEHYETKSLIKFAGFDDLKEAARFDFPKCKSAMHDPGPMMALDPHGDVPALWTATFGGTQNDIITKIEDRPEGLVSVPHELTVYRGHGSWVPPIACDRSSNELIAGGQRIDPLTGKATRINLEGEPGERALQGASYISAGPEGTLYFRSGTQLPNLEKIWRIRRFDRNGKFIPFKDGKEYLEANANHATTPFNDKGTHFTVGPDGKIYIVSAVSRQTRDVAVGVYGPDGDLVKPGLIAMTKSGGCIRVDRAGRIYASDTIRPRDRALPDCYESDPLNIFSRWYGSVVRYEPAGGGVARTTMAQATHLAGGKEESLTPVKVNGAMWSFYGLAPMPLQTGCQCVMERSGFDADDWGRVWVPDAPGYCVAALDSAGNLITRFGAYGNRDATGAGGAMPEPAIPLWYPDQTAALDGSVFVSDPLAGRIVQVNLTYADEATVTIR